MLAKKIKRIEKSSASKAKPNTTPTHAKWPTTMTPQRKRQRKASKNLSHGQCGSCCGEKQQRISSLILRIIITTMSHTSSRRPGRKSSGSCIGQTAASRCQDTNHHENDNVARGTVSCLERLQKRKSFMCLISCGIPLMPRPSNVAGVSTGADTWYECRKE